MDHRLERRDSCGDRRSVAAAAMTAMLAELVSIPSENPPGAAYDAVRGTRWRGR